MNQRPIFCVSDLHMGDGGPRDNFAAGNHERQFNYFLDMVEALNGRLIICGDLFELWQSNMSKVLTRRSFTLDRLAKMKAVYVLGNHDADLFYFTRGKWLAHPFFKQMTPSHMLRINGRWHYFVHGHEADPYCSGDTPGLGRITAIYSGLAEDKNGGPMLTAGRTVEGKVVGRLERLASFWGRLCGRPDRNTEMNRNLDTMRRDAGAQVIICGHTHFPGKIGGWHYNSGTWAESKDTFVRIEPNGMATVEEFVGPSGSSWETKPVKIELPI